MNGLTKAAYKASVVSTAQLNQPLFIASVVIQLGVPQFVLHACRLSQHTTILVFHCASNC